MFDWRWVLSTGSAAVMVGVSVLGIYAVLIALTRLMGLRSFSKMSSFDFPITVAIGSVLAGTVLSKDPPLAQGVTALVVLYVLQFVVSFLRRYQPVSEVVDNDPLLLMEGERILHENMRLGRVTMEDLKGKLRAANVINYKQVHAVVLESTGDISVLHGGSSDYEFDPTLLEGVRGRSART